MQLGRFMAVALATALLVLGQGAEAAVAKQKGTGSAENVVVINIDDLSPHALKVGAPTPNIDALADQGMTIDAMYATAAVCAPSRAGMHTGRLQEEFGIFKNPPEGAVYDDFKGDGIPGSAFTIAEAMGKADLKTGLVGKWHLGDEPQQLPNAQGYDEFIGYLGGGHGIEPGTGPLLRNSSSVRFSLNLTDFFAKEAVSFIDRNASRPFYLEVSTNATHEPLGATPQQLGKCSKYTDNDERLFCGMLVGLDDLVGDVMEALRRNKLDRDTMVILTADNGCAMLGYCDSGVFKLGKGKPWEGGVRVPGIFWMPGVIQAGTTYTKAPISHLDIMPTVLSAVGGNIPSDLDGRNVLPWLIGNTGDADRTLFFATAPGRGSVRRGKWKLYFEGGTKLYNLENDPDESNDVAAKNQAKVKELSPVLQRWFDSLPKPAY